MIINNKKKYYLAYTLIFSMLMTAIVLFYYLNGKSMINSGGDGFRQYFRALVYYSDYLKNIVRNIIDQHKVIIPQWDFSIGEGSDVLITFHYYGMGDIINVLSVFVPKNRMYFFYDASIALRIFLSGLTFSQLCFYLKKNHYDAVLTGCVLYAFSGYALLSACGHIAFLNASVYLPLVILGTEKIIRDKRPLLFSLSVALISLTSFYFFYMIALMTAIYVAVRLLCMDITWKERGTVLLRITLFSLLGLLISAVIFLPFAYATLTSSRISGSIETPLIYSLSYYYELIHSFVFSYGNLFGNYSIFAVPAVIILFRKENSKALKILLVISCVSVCLPAFGLMFNGFVYATDRWLFGFSLIMNYIIVDTYDDLLKSKKEAAVFCSALLLYLLACAFMDKEQWQIYALFGALSLGVSITIGFFKKEKIISFVCLCAAIFTAFFSIFYRFSPMYWNYSKNGTSFSKAEDIQYKQALAATDLNDEFYRYTTNNFMTNSSVQSGQSTTQYYWSLANDNVIEFRNYLGLSDHNNHHYDSYDNRLSLNALACVRYFVKEGETPLPYGFEKTTSSEGYEVAESEYSLPLVYAYSDFVDEESWKNINLLSRQNLLLLTAVTGEKINTIPEHVCKEELPDFEFVMKTDAGIKLSDSLIVVKEENSSIDFSFDYEKGFEYYIVIEGFDSDISTNIGVIDCSGEEKTLFFKCRTHNAYPDRHDFALYIGESDSDSGEAMLVFPDCGEYSYTSIKIQRLPIEEQIKSINLLKQSVESRSTIGTNRIETELNLKDNSLVCFAVPYSSGWKAVVDGQEADIIRTNIMYMGLELAEGPHSVKLEYSTPCLKAGAFASGAGIALYIWLAIKEKRRNFKNR